MNKNSQNRQWSFAGLLVAMGVVYGDIGTSPLYVMKALIAGNKGMENVSPDFILGSVSLIFWTLALLTSVKYVIIALNADNHGEGGIFSLYTLVRHKSKHLIIPAMIGGATLLADSVLTPAVTVTTAIEGLRGLPELTRFVQLDQTKVIIITLIILAILFSVQHLGTDSVGKAFGPIMFGWFTYLAIVGIINYMHDWTVIRALNPYYAIKVLFSPNNKLGLFVLGNIFLATTGAEALYSDMGHVGKLNIRISWPYVKICLIFNYLGQAAWLIHMIDHPNLIPVSDHELNPFFSMMPNDWQVFGVIFATAAAVIASQALLSGAFTLVSEAIKLKIMPRFKITYPGSSRGQLYLPAVNTILWLLCSLIVLGFKTSAKMEAAYGLAITVTMLMTTLLLYFYMEERYKSKIIAFVICTFFGLIESVFFLTSLAKFMHGGFVAVGLALLILSVMVIWVMSNRIQYSTSRQVHLRDYLNQLEKLRKDKTMPLYHTNVVYLVPKMDGDLVDREYIYSILDKKPKKAKAYWFINVEVTDQPYTKAYEIETLGTDYAFLVKLYLGFKEPQTINVYLRQIVTELMLDGRLPIQPQKYSVTPGRQVGDFVFVLIDEELGMEGELSRTDRFIIQTKFSIKRHFSAVDNWFGLQYSDVVRETVPFNISETHAYRDDLIEVPRGTTLS